MDALGINLPGLITQLVSFLILFAVLWMVLYKPISKAMGDRSKKIQDSLEAADKAQEEANSSREAMEKQISDSRVEGQKMIANAKDIADRFKEEELVKAREEIKAEIERIREEDPSGYIKIKRFWYSAEKNLNKYFDKQVEEHLKEEHPELFDKFFKKLKWTYFWCNFEKISEKYKEKVAEEILKIEDPEAYKSVLFRKKIKLALLLTSAILIVVGISMFSIQECSFDKITDGSAKTADERELNCKSPLF